MNLYSFIILLGCCCYSFAQGNYHNEELHFKFSYNDSWEFTNKQDFIVLYNAANDITMTVIWEQMKGEIPMLSNEDIEKINTNEILRVKDSFSYEFYQSEKGTEGKQVKAIASFKGLHVQVLFTAVIPKSHIDYNTMNLLNKVTNSFVTLYDKTSNIAIDAKTGF